jgi:hypothetical protein
MPLTSFQKDVLAVIAGNRSEDSQFAGGLVLNAAFAAACRLCISMTRNKFSAKQAFSAPEG